MGKVPVSLNARKKPQSLLFFLLLFLFSSEVVLDHERPHRVPESVVDPVHTKQVHHDGKNGEVEKEVRVCLKRLFEQLNETLGVAIGSAALIRGL